MLFILKKWVGSLLMPLPLFLLVFLIGLILLFFTQKQKAAKLFLVISFSGLLLLSLLPVSQSLLLPLERKHPPVMQAKLAQHVDYILLLGSGGVADPSLPITGQLSATALSRFMEALRIYHANPNAKLVVSGSGFGDLQSHAQLVETLALSVGVPSRNIIRLDNTQDTDDEARLMSEMIRGKKSMLVTSATHMDRAMQLFYKYGTGPIAAPANFMAPTRNGEIPLHYYLPSAHNLDNSTKAWHEYVGRLQNWVKSFF
ncbi:envelope biogenesis factor ElyC [Psychromonas sp. PT13]|uniref:envelope biogenesis factor ElyC n=1 Tax=Psychromonas sp. PT13 TaxID=3439547 RepID=UPI003EBB3794